MGEQLIFWTMISLIGTLMCGFQILVWTDSEYIGLAWTGFIWGLIWTPIIGWMAYEDTKLYSY